MAASEARTFAWQRSRAGNQNSHSPRTQEGGTYDTFDPGADARSGRGKGRAVTGRRRGTAGFRLYRHGRRGPLPRRLAGGNGAAPADRGAGWADRGRPGGRGSQGTASADGRAAGRPGSSPSAVPSSPSSQARGGAVA